VWRCHPRDERGVGEPHGASAEMPAEELDLDTHVALRPQGTLGSSGDRGFEEL